MTRRPEDFRRGRGDRRRLSTNEVEHQKWCPGKRSATEHGVDGEEVSTRELDGLWGWVGRGRIDHAETDGQRFSQANEQGVHQLKLGGGIGRGVSARRKGFRLRIVFAWALGRVPRLGRIRFILLAARQY